MFANRSLMGNWYKQITLLLATVSSIWIEPQLAAAGNPATKVRECRELNSSYQEVYSFETENYYINVCQLEENFYYHRQSKSAGSRRNLLLPAQAILQGSVFQATVGKVVYFVGIDSDRHYSSVMLNNNEIVFEPEIEPVSRTISQSSDSSQLELGDRHLQNASLELDSPTAETEAVLACDREKSAFHPHLTGWQELVGKPISSASSYALENGYSFNYDREKNPTLALATTAAGGKIDLVIVPDSETIERVCIQSPSLGKN